MKILETRTRPSGGFGGCVRETRVRTLPEGEPLPEGAVEMPDDMPEHDWQEEN